MTMAMRIGAMAAAAAMLAAGGPATAAGNPASGKAAFARCVTCHAIAPGRNGIGPSLAGVVGRRAGALPGFAFSPAMKKSRFIWTPAALDKYLANPRTAVPGTKMAFAGVPKPADRANLIAYLATLKK
ncbi:MAG TPA: cytochrome c family protein [Allosphingosinicella sp.]|jgi:cytochrome c